MARRKGDTVFAEAAGKTVDSIRYEENSEWQALVITFRDGKVFSLEFGARIDVQASYLEMRRGDLKIIRKYGRISGGSDQKR